jgi:hypothetical protein
MDAGQQDAFTSFPTANHRVRSVSKIYPYALEALTRIAPE